MIKSENESLSDKTNYDQFLSDIGRFDPNAGKLSAPLVEVYKKVNRRTRGKANVHNSFTCTIFVIEQRAFEQQSFVKGAQERGDTWIKILLHFISQVID